MPNKRQVKYLLLERELMGDPTNAARAVICDLKVRARVKKQLEEMIKDALKKHGKFPAGKLILSAMLLDFILFLEEQSN